jgi:hypothetical protein
VNIRDIDADETVFLRTFQFEAARSPFFTPLRRLTSYGLRVAWAATTAALIAAYLKFHRALL